MDAPPVKDPRRAAGNDPPVGSRPRPPRPQSPASKGLRAGLLGTLAAALLALGANDSWLLPALDPDGVVYLVAAQSLARGDPEPRVPVAHWNAEEEARGLGDRPRVIASALAAGIRSGTRGHVAALWLLAASLAALVLAAGWTAGGASGTGGGLLASFLLLASPVAVEAATSLRPEPLAAAAVCLQLGLVAYRPRWHLVHGAAGALAWSLHPAGAGAVAAAAAWPLRPPRRRGASVGRGPSHAHAPGGSGNSLGASGPALIHAVAALAPAVLLLAAGPRLAWLPALPPVLDGSWGAGVFGGAMRWAGAGMAGWTGLALGAAVLALLASAVVLDALSTPHVDPDARWDDPRAGDLVAARTRSAAGLLVLGVGAAAVATGRGGGGLGTPELLLVGPLAVLAGMTAVRWAGRTRGRARAAVVGAVALWLALSSVTALDRAGTIREEGRGLTAARWIDAETIRWLDNRAPPGVVVYASSPHLVLVQTGRPARTLPTPGESFDAFAGAFARRPGVVVLTGADTLRADAFADRLILDRVVRGREGHVLVPRPGSSATTPSPGRLSTPGG